VALRKPKARGRATVAPSLFRLSACHSLRWSYRLTVSFPLVMRLVLTGPVTVPFPIMSCLERLTAKLTLPRVNLPGLYRFNPCRLSRSCCGSTFTPGAARIWLQGSGVNHGNPRERHTLQNTLSLLPSGLSIHSACGPVVISIREKGHRFAVPPWAALSVSARLLQPVHS
jgi:hypothetical protein